MSAFKVVLTDQAPIPSSGYSQALRWSDLIVTSGYLGTHADGSGLVKGGFEAEVRQAILNISQHVGEEDRCRLRRFQRWRSGIAFTYPDRAVFGVQDRAEGSRLPPGDRSHSQDGRGGDSQADAVFEIRRTLVVGRRGLLVRFWLLAPCRQLQGNAAGNREQHQQAQQTPASNGLALS